MSQEPPNSQPPLSPDEPEAEKPETTVRKVTQTAQPVENSFQTVLKAQTIKLLRGTIRVLEGVAVKLEAEPVPTTEPSWLDKLLVGWSAALAKIRSLLPQNLSSKLSDTALTAIVAGIAVILVWTTSAVLPGQPNAPAKPPEVANAPSPQPEEPPEVANTPSAEPVPIPTIPTPPELTAPAEPQPVEVTPAP